MDDQLIFPPHDLGVSPLDLDSVPATFEEAAKAIAAALSPEAREAALKLTKPEWTAQVHFGGGMQIRNAFSLWERDTLLDLDFWHRWEIWHGDDKSGMLMSAVYDWLHNKPFDPAGDARSFHMHWNRAGVRPVRPPSREI
jgi:hypothetical protein